MNSVRRLKVAGAILALAAVITTAHVWGQASKRRLNKKPQVVAAETGESFSEALATAKFSQGGIHTYRTTAGETLFALQLQPELPPAPRRPRDVLVMVDTSASQARLPLATAIQLSEDLVKSLDAKDRVSLWTVNTPKATKDLTRGFRSPETPQVADALAGLRKELPLGNSDLKEALKRAVVSFERAADRQAVIVLLGDGMSVYNPITSADRNHLCEELNRAGISFYAVPLGLQLEAKNLHGLAARTGGTVVRRESKETVKDVSRKLAVAFNVPVFQVKNFALSGGVAESFPTVLPPLRGDTPTLVVGRLEEGKALTYSLEGTLAGADHRIEKTITPGEPEPDNFFLVGMVEQWRKAKDQPALTRADRALSWAYDQSQLVRADLIAQAEWALGQDKLEAAHDLFERAKKLDPSDVEADAGIKVVNKIRNGLLNKTQIARQLAQAGPGGLEQLAQAAGGGAAREGAQPADKEDLLQQMKARTAVEEQRVTEQVDRSISEARRTLASDPDQAKELLKRTYAAVRDNPDLGDRVRQLLINRLEASLRNVDVQGPRIKRERDEQAKALADAERILQLEEARASEEERTRRRMLQFINLFAQARYEDAYQQALAIKQDAVTAGRPIPPAVTAGYDVGLQANQVDQLQELNRVRQERFLLTMMQVERSHIPFPDEPPIQFPPAATWREITKLRKEKYESSGFTEDDPATLQAIRRLKNELTKPMSLNEGIPANTPLKDALDIIDSQIRGNVTIIINQAAFKGEGGTDDVESQPVKLPRMGNVSLATVLRLLTAQVGGTYLVRRDFIEITTPQKAVLEKVVRVYPVADLVIPIPNALNVSSAQQQLSILGTAPGLGLNIGGPQALGGLGNLGNLGGLGLGGLGVGGLGLGGLGLGGGLGGLGIGGLAGGAGQAGGPGGLGFGGGGQVNLGAGGGQLGLGGGQLGQFGNLGGQFGLQGGDQSFILVELIRQVVGKEEEWRRPGYYQRPPAGGFNPAGGPGSEEQELELLPSDYLNALGYYPPARALVVRGTSRIHTSVYGGVFEAKGVGGMVAAPKEKGKDRVAKNQQDAQNRFKDIVAANQKPGDRQPKAGKQENKPGAAQAPGQLANLDATKVWQEALAKGVNDSGLIIACADFLAQHKLYNHLAEFLKANLRQGIIVKPWVYEALTAALEGSQGDPAEIERARLSAVDLEPQDAQGYVRTAKAMADMKDYSRAVAFCKQASLLEPNAAQPFEEALVVAELAKDSAAMEWAAGGLLRQDWPENSEDLHQKARSKVNALAKALSTQQPGQAKRLVQSADLSKQRDLVIELRWQGDADLDLEVKEPIGTQASFLQRQTAGGGILIGDTMSNASGETYVAAQAFGGEYQVTIRKIWGRPLGGKATLRIVQHQGTPRQIERWETISFDRSFSTTVALDDGRRTTADLVPLPTQRKAKPAVSTPDRALTKLRMLADPELVPSERRATGGMMALGVPTESSRSAIEQPKVNPGAEVYQSKIRSISGSGFDLIGEATVTADKGVVMKMSPIFHKATRGNAAPAVVNPLIPGGEGQ